MRMVLGIEVGAGGVLHPGVRDQYPQSGEIAADRDQPSDDEMLQPAQAIPAEEEQADERALEKKRHQAFNREGHAKDNPRRNASNKPNSCRIGTPW